MTRDKEVRYEYKPSSTLTDPTPIPGVAFRWVATHILSVADPTNVSRKMRDGWEPVKAADHPELMLPGDKNGNVEVGGLMLCKMPKARAEAIDAYYAKQNQAQMESVDNNFMRQSDPRMPLFAERKSSTTKGATFGSGSK
jgi:hypothetical protein